MHGMWRTTTACVALLLTVLACDGEKPHGSVPDGGIPVTGDEPIVALGAGQVLGVEVDGVLSFRGIPYAAPPVGERRFRAPVRPASWTGVRDATGFGAPCPQRHGTGTVGQEDCLTLNVWVPTSASEPLPVMVYLHGGDNYWGSSTGRTSDGLYDGTELARRGAVVVTLNYRLGALGFLSHESLRDGVAAGNWALLDQLAALRWVRENIGRFGGDASRVLLFGQSAGSYDACALLTSPLSAGLFHAVAMQSGPCWIPPAADIERGVVSTLEHVGCSGATDVASCLRSVDADLLATAPVSASDLDGLHKFFYPVVDGYVLDAPPIAALETGSFHPMPLLFGTNEDEMTTLLAGLHLSTAAQYHAAVVATVGEDLAIDVENQYIAEAILSYDYAYYQMTGDLFFHCRVRRSVRAAAQGQTAPIWRYSYAHTIEDGEIGGLSISLFGAGHGLELLPLFRGHPDWWQPTADEIVLSDLMMDAWRGLAADGSVEPAVPDWPRYDPDTDPFAVLDGQVSFSTSLRSEDCDFWDEHDPTS